MAYKHPTSATHSHYATQDPTHPIRAYYASDIPYATHPTHPTHPTDPTYPTSNTYITCNTSQMFLKQYINIEILIINEEFASEFE